MKLIQKTLFKIPKMDCHSEVQLIRQAFANESNIKDLNFDLPSRELTIYHSAQPNALLAKLSHLGLGAQLVATENVSTHNFDESRADVATSYTESRTLRLLLGVNGLMFFLEFGMGFISQSTGLIADSLDMLADAAIYGLSLYAVGQVIGKQRRYAKLSGYLQLLLASFTILEVIRRFLFGSSPEAPYMISIALLALAANVGCLLLLQKHKDGGVHMKASVIFSTNDVIANCGVIIAGILVSALQSNVPDLLIGLIIGMLVFRGALRVLKLSRP